MCVFSVKFHREGLRLTSNIHWSSLQLLIFLFFICLLSTPSSLYHFSPTLILSLITSFVSHFSPALSLDMAKKPVPVGTRPNLSRLWRVIPELTEYGFGFGFSPITKSRVRVRVWDYYIRPDSNLNPSRHLKFLEILHNLIKRPRIFITF